MKLLERVFNVGFDLFFLLSIFLTVIISDFTMFKYFWSAIKNIFESFKFFYFNLI